MVTVKKAKRSKCVWCAKTREGVEVSFADGSLNAFVCWADFRKLLKTRSEHSEANPAEVATARREKKP